MTVAIDNPYTELRWTGVEGTFATGIQAQSKSHIAMEYRLDGSETVVPLFDGVHVVLTRDATTELITATPTAAMPLPPGTIAFERKTPAVQGTDFANLVGFAPSVHTRLHDASALRDQELGSRISRGADEMAALLELIEAALALLQQSVPINVPIFATRAAVSNAAIEPSVKSLTTRGWSTDGDGGNWPIAVRVGAQPTHPGSVRSLDRYMPDGSLDGTNGGWWEVVPHAGPLNFEAFGAVGDDATDNTTAFRGMNDYINLKGGGVMLWGSPGKSYVVWPDNASAQTYAHLFFGQNARGVNIDFRGSRWHSKYLGEHTVWGFHLENCQDWLIQNLRGLHDAGISGVAVAGQAAGLVWGAVITGCKRIRFLNVDLDGGNKGIQGFADYTAVIPNAPEQVEVTGKIANVYYGLSFQAGPHDAKIDVITHGEIGRSIIAYNIIGLRGRIQVTDGTWHNQQIALSISTHSASPWWAKIEADLKICYHGTASTPRSEVLAYLVMSPQDPALGEGGGGGIAHIKLDFDVTFPSSNPGSAANELFGMDSYKVSGGAVVLGTPDFGGHSVLLEFTGNVRGDVGAATDFMQLAKAANGWTAASTGVVINFRNWVDNSTRPIVIGTCCRGGIERSVFRHTPNYVREAPAVPSQFNIYGETLQLIDGMTAPTLNAGAQIFVDGADGDLKVRFGDGVVKTIVTDT